MDTHETIDVDTALELARTDDRDVPRSTVRWRLHEMVQRGALQRLRRGVYTRQDKREFRLPVADSLSSLFHAVRENLPYVELCVWRSDVLQDRNLFGFLEGAETHHIYESASDRYHIQLDTLLRYASRRGAKDEIELIIGQITGNVSI